MENVRQRYIFARENRWATGIFLPGAESLGLDVAGFGWEDSEAGQRAAYLGTTALGHA